MPSAKIIDFNTVELVNSYEPQEHDANQLQKARRLHAHRLNAVLQTTIDLNEMLNLFFNELTKSLKIDGLRYENTSADYRLTLGNTRGNACRFKVTANEDQLGEISIFRPEPEFSNMEQTLFRELIGSLIYPLRNGLRYQEAVTASLKDGLTGAGNRLRFEGVINHEVELAKRYGDDLSILMIDIDHFKSINDTYGHLAGDAVLRNVATILKTSCRCADMSFRYGGEEFAIILNKTNVAGAKVIAERIRVAIEKFHHKIGEQSIQVTACIGISSLNKADTKDSWLHRADQALYDAKENGRNQVACGESE